MLAALGRYLRRHHLALLALFVALGGTAYALTNDSVRSKHIKDGQVKPSDLGVVKFDAQVAQNNVLAGGEEQGPQVGFKVPGSGLVAVMLRADIRMLDDGPTNICSVSVDTGEADIRLLTNLSETTPFREVYSSPGTQNEGTIASNTAWSDGGWVLFEVDPGPATFTSELNSGGSSVCEFKDVHLWAAPVG